MPLPAVLQLQLHANRLNLQLCSLPALGFDALLQYFSRLLLFYSMPPLKGTAGKAINAILIAAVMNFQKILGAFGRIFYAAD
jgi:hypothetical protein